MTRRVADATRDPRAPPNRPNVPPVHWVINQIGSGDLTFRRSKTNRLATRSAGVAREVLAAGRSVKRGRHDELATSGSRLPALSDTSASHLRSSNRSDPCGRLRLPCASRAPDDLVVLSVFVSVTLLASPELRDSPHVEPRYRCSRSRPSTRSPSISSAAVLHDMHLLWSAALLAASPCGEALYASATPGRARRRAGLAASRATRRVRVGRRARLIRLARTEPRDSTCIHSLDARRRQ